MNLLPVLHQRQRQQADCLAACTAMVLNYLKLPVDYQRLLRLLNIKAHGASLHNLYNLKALGLFVLIEEGDISKLQAHLEIGLPPIVAVSTSKLSSYWKEDTDHAVVVVGIDEGFVYLNDPEFVVAPQLVTLEEFESAWLEQDYWYAVIGLDEI